ncbi:MAG: MarR family transcriptional regulator [Actinobacteria bacterium]|nr:MAG: MarR family transcriptional regulator [Actinomycetota bacterium]
MNALDSKIVPKTLVARPPRALISSTSHLLKRLGFKVKERSVDAFEGSGVTPMHYGVLVLLDEDPRETQATIADALGYDRSHLVGLLDELEEGGLIERRRDPDDRRRHLVSLTPEGRKALTRLRAIVTRVDDEFLAPLDADERATLHQLLLKLAAAHDERYAPNGSA